MVARPKADAPSTIKWTRIGTQSQPGTDGEDSHRRRRRHVVLLALLALLLAAAAFGIYRRLTAPPDAPNRVAEGLRDDRVNIVLIGVGGDEHPGGGKDLADAIIVVSLKPSTRQAALISIPRDYLVPLGIQGTHRINAAHALGGPALVMRAAEAILGQPMHAYVRIDFKAFEKVIDELGGVDVYVQRPFYDVLFKDGFRQGWQHMSGRRALRFARYRYINSEEGNNYARELRQQQILAALRAKLEHASADQTLHLMRAARSVSANTSTNLTTAQLIALFSTYRTIPGSHVRHVSLAPFTRLVASGDPLDPTPAVGPILGTNRGIHEMARTVFSSEAPIVTPTQIRPGDHS